MKIIIVLFVLAAFVASDDMPDHCVCHDYYPETTEAEKDYYDAVMDCYLIGSLFSMEVPEQCLVMCSFKKMDWINDDGYFITEELLKDDFPFHGSDEMKAFLASEIEKCADDMRSTSNSISKEKGCTVHHETLDCAEEALRKECQIYWSEETSEE